MPTTAPSSRLDNITKSIFAYIRTNVETGLGLTVYYQDAQLIDLNSTASPTRWVEVSTIPLSRVSDIVPTQTGRRGWLKDHLISMNVYQKSDVRRAGTVGIYALWTTAEQIRDWFMPKSYLPIRDYNTGGNPIVGGFRAEDEPSLTRISTDAYLAAGISQVNISATMRTTAEIIE